VHLRCDCIHAAVAVTGELGKLQSAAARARGGSESGVMLAALTAAPARSTADSRGHLEANMAAALALESPQEYRRWLLTYARFLSGAAIVCIHEPWSEMDRAGSIAHNFRRQQPLTALLHRGSAETNLRILHCFVAVCS